MKISTLTIEMAADVARLRQDMDRAQKAVDSALGGIKGAANAAMKVLGSLGLGFSAFKFGTFIRGAINAADEMSKLSQKMGVAVKDVAGLQLAFRQSGLEAGALQANMARLSRGIADGNKALEAMGVVTRNTDGSLRTTRQVLGDVADRFASYKNGAAKAALAQELFGRSGADMIPLLNGGAAALDEFDAIAQRLGLTLDEETARQAEKFNDTLDLMGQGVQGVGRQVAAQLLPTLSGLASQFFTTMSEGDRLSRIADGLSAVLRGLYVVALGVVEAFSTVGRVLGGVSAIIVSVFKGDFSAARNIAQELRNDLTGGWKDALAQMQNAWKATGNASFEALATANAEARRQPPLIEAATRAVERRAAVDREALRRELEAARLRNAAFDEEERRLEAIRLASERRIRTAREMLEGIQFETSLLRMNNTQRRIAIAMRDLERQGVVAGTEAYDALARRIRDAIEAQEEMKASLANAPVLDTTEWDRHWEQVSQSFTDALMQGGRSVAEYLKSLFRTLILRPILAPVGGAFASAMGGPAMAGQGAASSGVGMLGQISGLAGAFGTGMAASFSSIMAAGVGGWATAAGSLIGTGAISGIAAGLGMIAGPLALAALAWKPLFGRKLADSGIQGTFGAEGFQGEQFGFFKGGLFRSDKTRTSALDAGMQSALGQQFQGMQRQAAAMAQTLGQSAEGIEQFNTSIKISFRGLSESQIQERLTQEFDRLANEMADLVPGLEQFAQVGETSSQTLQRLAGSLSAVNQAFDTLGLSLLGGMDGADFASQLVAAAGGVDALNTSVSFYFQNFYGEAERLETMTRQTTEALAALGFEMPATREGFRAMVEAARSMGDPALVANLLALAPAVAAVTQAAPVAMVQPVVARSQEVSRGVDTLANSLQRLGDSVAGEIRRLRGLIDESSGESLSVLQARFATTTASARAGNQEALAALPGLSRSLEEAAKASASSAVDVARMRSFLASSLSGTLGALRLDIPQFAVGTNFVPRDTLAVVHQGEAIVPRAYNPAAGGSNPDMDVLVSEVRLLRAETQATAKHTHRLARILERVTPDGDAIQTREANP